MGRLYKSSKIHSLPLRSNILTLPMHRIIFCPDTPEIDNNGFGVDAWLQLVLATLARDNNFSPLNTHHIKHPILEPVQLRNQRWLCLLSICNFRSVRSFFPTIFHRFLRKRHNSLPYIQLPSTHAKHYVSHHTSRPCGLQH